MGRTPLILQHDAAECGAACLAMVLGHHGSHVSLDELRVRCGVSRNGSRASAIIAAAATYKLAGKGFRCEVPDLAQLPMPCVLFWNFNHFVVLDGVERDGRARIMDPGLGERIVSAGEMDRSFTGVVLTFEPGQDYVPTGTRPSLWAMLRERLTGTEKASRLLLAFALLSAVPMILMPALSRVFVDEVLLRSQWRWINAIIAAAAATACFQMLSIAFRRRLVVAIEAWTITAGEARFLNHLFSLPLSFFSQRHTGELVDRMTAFTRFAQTLTGPLADGFTGAVTGLMMLAAALLVDPVTGLAVTVMSGIVFAGSWYSGRAIIARGAFVRRAESLLAAATLEGIRLMEVTRAAGRASDSFSRWSGHYARASAERSSLLMAQTRLQIGPRALIALTGVVVLAIAGARAMDGAITIGQIAALQMIAGALMKPLGDIVSAFLAAPDLKADIARVNDVFHHGTEAVPRAAANLPARGRLEFRDVTFGYARTEKPTVHNVSFVIEPGRRTAIAGHSGGGKSSIAKLAAGLYLPWSGEVLLDGVPVSSLAPADRTALVALVDQTIVLFEGTVRDNLAMFRPELSDARAAAALRDVAMLPDIEARPRGLDARVVEFGANFSGGQRQRLEIARAIANDPALLILDEATAALDPVVEAEIEANLRRRGISSLVIAHRLSTIRDADDILVLDQGHVVEFGRHHDLIALNGLYRSLAGGGE
jgi:NHLM bacteriocin system ABC transporter peptidase/ATP-binding protein